MLDLPICQFSALIFELVYLLYCLVAFVFRRSLEGPQILWELHNVPASTKLENIFDLNEETSESGNLFEVSRFILFVLESQVSELKLDSSTILIAAISFLAGVALGFGLRRLLMLS